MERVGPDRLDADAELLERVRRGDEQAMAGLYDRYSRVVYSVAMRVLRDPASSEEVLQEVFLGVWRRPESFAARGSVGGWLAVMARNRAIDLLRRKRPSEQVEDVQLVVRYNLADEAERNRLAESARTVVRRLPPDQRKTLEMAFFDGLTHTEIAEMMGDSLGMVKARLRSALGVLRKDLEA
jgi:RNA polymerase sigma-70 factor, ECF subfamily